MTSPSETPTTDGHKPDFLRLAEAAFLEWVTQAKSTPMRSEVAIFLSSLAELWGLGEIEFPSRQLDSPEALHLLESASLLPSIEKVCARGLEIGRQSRASVTTPLPHVQLVGAALRGANERFTEFASHVGIDTITPHWVRLQNAFIQSYCDGFMAPKANG